MKPSDFSNIFRITYIPSDSTEFTPAEAYVVIPTWEDLIEYIHKHHGALITAESVNCRPLRVRTIVADKEDY